MMEQADFIEVCGENAVDYFEATQIAVMLWSNMHLNSRVDWSPYRIRIWDIFESRLRFAIRTGRTIQDFLSRTAKELSLITLGKNDDERNRFMFYTTAPQETQNKIMRQLRDNLPIIILYTRLYTDNRRADWREEYDNG